MEVRLLATGLLAFRVNLTQAGASLKEETSVEKTPPARLVSWQACASLPDN